MRHGTVPATRAGSVSLLARIALPVSFVTCTVLAPACGGVSDDPVERAAARQRQFARYQAREALDECAAHLAIFPPGTAPDRPYRVLGPVEGRFGFTVEARFQAMRKSACELGAQGIIDAGEHEEVVAATRTTTTAVDDYGRPVTVVEEPRSVVRHVRGIAVVFAE
jgi:hypothetical protein